MNKLNCLMVGENSLLVQCAEILLDRGHRVAAVATVNDAVRQWASAKAIAVLPSDGDLAAAVAGIEFDWLFSAANLRIIPETVWGKALQGAANFHDGPLPELAGINTPSWAIIEGRPRHGVTWHAMTGGIDKGDVYAQLTFDVSPDESSLTLNTKCLEAGIATFGSMVGDLEKGALAPQKQDLTKRTYRSRKMRPEAAATLRFDRPSEELDRLVRGLDFGRGYPNPMLLPKVQAGGVLHAVDTFKVLEPSPSAEPGLVVAVSGDGVTIGTADRPVLVDGAPLGGTGRRLSETLRVGDRLEVILPSEIEALNAAVLAAVAHEEADRNALMETAAIEIAGVQPLDPAEARRFDRLSWRPSSPLSPEEWLALAATFLIRLSGRDTAHLALSSDTIAGQADRFPGYFSASLPIRLDAPHGTTAADLVDRARAIISGSTDRSGALADLPERNPGLARIAPSFGVRLTGDLATASSVDGCAVTFVVSDADGAILVDRSRIADHAVDDLIGKLANLEVSFADRDKPLATHSLMSEGDRRRVLYDLNQTERDYEKDACVHGLIERQADLTPDAVAITFGDQEISYRDMDARANKVAHALIALGVGPDTIVGLHVPRGIDLVIGALGIQKAGGAYLPLDPDFPADRLALMVEDSAAKVIVTDRSLAQAPFIAGAARVVIEDVAGQAPAAARPASAVASTNLAYVIYTSGSTGRPKGVEVEHRNVVNFFAGMDERIPLVSGENVWLAVTSLSFDISVLELFWTLSRGFKVVIHQSTRKSAPTAGQAAFLDRSMDFGLFYWGNDDGVGPAKYNTLLEGAKFADAHGFTALWTPERHFHAFGGPYPNPAVTGAAVAAVTKNLSIRAGSCVLPLHHPARVAEEWSVIDNLSNGRVGVAFASGWMPEDFVLRPENAPPHNKAAMLRDIDVVRRLWRGEKVDFEFGSRTVGVVTQPRPVQKELPVWLTTAGNPDTYREAARAGANVLTHLLGQSVDELADKIRIYRETLRETGRNPDDYKVTLMLHTLLGEDRDAVRDLARAPMKDYLRSAAALIKQYAWAFPAFKKPQGVTQPMDVDLQSLAPEEMEAILEFAFLRYFEDSGLFGTVEDGIARIEQVSKAGVDEIACLIDFGLPAEIVLERLTPLADLVGRCRKVVAPADDAVPAGFAAEVARHKVTHLQCTPSMLRMFLLDADDRRAMGSVRHLFIGGEALQGSLLSEVASVTAATVENMYGPTETTIWSSTMRARPTEGVVPLGKPIANTQLYVLDAHGQPVPPGLPGELFIGGDGVTRGYLNRPELTAERFPANPFAKGRMYKTGDMVRYGDDGELQFLGRADFQVKVRGYRIELGEIEARVSSFPGVKEAVVVTREDRADDVRIIAYMKVAGPVATDALRDHVAATLPDYMVPSSFVTLESFPLTPNAKVDRNRLPAPNEKAEPALAYVAPADALQKTIAESFRRMLGVERVGLADNFFALGGHSLLAIQVHRDLKASVAPDLTITDLFRFPTVSLLAEHIGNRGKSGERLSKAADRAAMRRSALEERRSSFAHARNAG